MSANGKRNSIVKWYWVSQCGTWPHSFEGLDVHAIEIENMSLEAALNASVPTIAGADCTSCTPELLKLRKSKRAPLILLGDISPAKRAILLRSGADEIVSRAVTTDELAARMAILLEYYDWRDGKMQIGSLKFDSHGHVVTANDQTLSLMPREFDMLLYLARCEGVVVSRTDLLRHIWKIDFDPGTNSIEVHICRLRNKLKQLINAPQLKTYKGQGYRLDLLAG